MTGVSAREKDHGRLAHQVAPCFFLFPFLHRWPGLLYEGRKSGLQSERGSSMWFSHWDSSPVPTMWSFAALSLFAYVDEAGCPNECLVRPTASGQPGPTWPWWGGTERASLVGGPFVFEMHLKYWKKHFNLEKLQQNDQEKYRIITFAAHLRCIAQLLQWLFITPLLLLYNDIIITEDKM